MLSISTSQKLKDRLMKQLGLPVALPLQRSFEQACSKQMLKGKKVLFYSIQEYLNNLIPQIFHFEEALIHKNKPEDDSKNYDILLLDTIHTKDLNALEKVYHFFHHNIRNVNNNGHILLLSQMPEQCETIKEKTFYQSLDGIVRSLAKESGRKGIRVNMLQLDKDLLTDDKSNELRYRLHYALRFLLSEKSAFISAQTIKLSSELTSPDVTPLSLILKGKKALITGATGGIGAATARCMAREGAKLILLDLPQTGLIANNLAEELKGQVLFANLNKKDVADDIIKFIKDDCEGSIDILVHNAGITRDKTLAKMEHKFWQDVLQVNLQSIIDINEAILSNNLIRPFGRIIHLSSVTGIAGNFGQTNYAAAKAGLIAYTKELAKQLAPKGISVNAIAPGFIETQMTEKMPAMTKEIARKLSCLAQGGLPEDVAETITFLASPGACGITGQIIRVCGGNFLGA